MKKTVTANIGGFVFQIDDDAFEMLSRYLDRVRSKFSSEPGCDEIMADIENRIAETYQKKVAAGQIVIGLNDVKELIKQLGEPEQIVGEDEDTAFSSGYPYDDGRPSKRLYRDPDNAIIGGVCGGLSAYFGVDPTLLRVLFALSVFAGFGIMLYIILWIVVPKAKTTADRLEMRGERVNISNIKRSVEGALKDAGSNLQEFVAKAESTLKSTEARYKKKRTRASSEYSYSESGLDRSLKVVARVVVITVGVSLIFFGIILLGSFLVAMMGVPVNFGPGANFTNVSLYWLLDLVMVSKTMVVFSIIGLFLVFGIPLLAMTYAGVKLLFGFEHKHRFLGVATTSLWVLGLVICLIILVATGQNFANHRELTFETTLEHEPKQTLVIDVNDAKLKEWKNDPDVEIIFDNGFLLLSKDQQMMVGSPRLFLRESSEEKIKVVVNKGARGKNSREASNMASEIDYFFEKTDSIIRFEPFFKFNRSEGWRVQEVTVEVFIPKDINIETTQALRNSMRVRNRLTR